MQIKARDVLIALRRPDDVSALNVIAATVAEIGPLDGPGVLIRLDCSGEALVARLTRYSVERLALSVGAPVFAIVKSVSIDRASLGAAWRDVRAADAEAKSGIASCLPSSSSRGGLDRRIRSRIRDWGDASSPSELGGDPGENYSALFPGLRRGARLERRARIRRSPIRSESYLAQYPALFTKMNMKTAPLTEKRIVRRGPRARTRDARRLERFWLIISGKQNRAKIWRPAMEKFLFAAALACR